MSEVSPVKPGSRRLEWLAEERDPLQIKHTQITEFTETLPVVLHSWQFRWMLALSLLYSNKLHEISRQVSSLISSIAWRFDPLISSWPSANREQTAWTKWSVPSTVFLLLNPFRQSFFGYPRHTVCCGICLKYLIPAFLISLSRIWASFPVDMTSNLTVSLRKYVQLFCLYMYIVTYRNFRNVYWKVSKFVNYFI